MMLYVRALSVALLAVAAPSIAAPPEQLYAMGPEAGKWTLGYNGQAAIASGADRPHSIELWTGLSDRLALGVEGEGEASDDGFHVEEVAIQGLVALTSAEAPLAAALLLQVGVETDGELPQLEARLIASHVSNRWNALANLIARRETGDEFAGEIAYAAAIHRHLVKGIGVGLEASGSMARLVGFDAGYERGHYVGPSLSIGVEPSEGRELEIGVKLLRRLAGRDAAMTTLRLAMEVEF